MAVKGGPQIVTDGLILALDSSSDRCYSSGSMSDLSGKNEHYELLGWTLSEASGAISILHGESVTTDLAYIRSVNGIDGTVSDSITELMTNGLYTIEFWVMATASPTDGSQQCGSSFSNNADGTTSGNQLQINLGFNSPANSAIRVYGQAPTVSGTLSLQEWKCYTVTCEAYGSASGSLYENGVLTISFAVSNWAGNTGTPYHYLMRDVDDLNNFAGHVGAVRVYNRILSADEVLQNYNALKGRFR